MGDLRQGLGPLGPLPGSVGLQACLLVGYDRLERPLVAVVLHEPGELLVVGRVNVGGRHQGCQTLFDIARHRHDPQVLGVVPLRHLVRPRRLSHAQGGQHQHRVHVLDAGQVLQRRQHGDRLAAAHGHPQGATGLLVDVVYGVVLVRVRDEGAAHVISAMATSACVHM